MQVLSNGKVRRSAGEWREVFSRWKKSSLSPEDFCKKHEIRPSSFRRWQQRIGNANSLDAAFIPVTPEPPSSVPTSGWLLEVTLPNGVQLRFQG